MGGLEFSLWCLEIAFAWKYGQAMGGDKIDSMHSEEKENFEKSWFRAQCILQQWCV